MQHLLLKTVWEKLIILKVALNPSTEQKQVHHKIQTKERRNKANKKNKWIFKLRLKSRK